MQEKRRVILSKTQPAGKYNNIFVIFISLLFQGTFPVHIMVFIIDDNLKIGKHVWSEISVI